MGKIARGCAKSPSNNGFILGDPYLLLDEKYLNNIWYDIYNYSDGTIRKDKNANTFFGVITLKNDDSLCNAEGSDIVFNSVDRRVGLIPIELIASDLNVLDNLDCYEYFEGTSGIIEYDGNDGVVEIYVDDQLISTYEEMVPSLDDDIYESLHYGNHNELVSENFLNQYVKKYNNKKILNEYIKR